MDVSLISVVRARSGDAEAVARLMAAMYAPPELPFTVWASPKAARYVADLIDDREAPESPAFHVLRRGGEPVGAIHLRLIDGAPFIDGVYTDPAARKDQLSNLLVCSALQDYRRFVESGTTPVSFDGAESKPAVRAWHRRVLGAEEVHRRRWWRVPLRPGDGGWAEIRGLEDADRIHERWGFSRIAVATSKKSYAVGRLPGPYFRVADSEAASDSELHRALRMLDASRDLCVIGEPEWTPEEGGLIDTFVRSRVPYDELVRRLKAQIPAALLAKPEPVVS